MVGERGMEVCGVAAGGCTGGGKDLNCQSVSQSVFRNEVIKKEGYGDSPYPLLLCHYSHSILIVKI